MPAFLDDQTIDISCPHCGKKHQKSLGWLKTNDHIACDCGVRLDFEKTQFTAGMGEVEKAFTDFERSGTSAIADDTSLNAATTRAQPESRSRSQARNRSRSSGASGAPNASAWGRSTTKLALSTPNIR